MSGMSLISATSAPCSCEFIQSAVAQKGHCIFIYILHYIYYFAFILYFTFYIFIFSLSSVILFTGFILLYHVHFLCHSFFTLFFIFILCIFILYTLYLGVGQKLNQRVEGLSGPSLPHRGPDVPPAPLPPPWPLGRSVCPACNA